MIVELKNLFSKQELSTLKQMIAALPESSFSENKDLGRLITNDIKLPEDIYNKLINTISGVLGKDVVMANPVWVEYSNKYGDPRLPTHFDGDSNEFIIDFQLSSSPNTVWPLGVNSQTYVLEDNSAIAFNPNTNIHWRPNKSFKDGDAIQMLFFRFSDPANPVDYSYLPNHPDDEVFKEVNVFKKTLDEY
jgi:hypothetical protein